MSDSFNSKNEDNSSCTVDPRQSYCSGKEKDLPNLNSCDSPEVPHYDDLSQRLPAETIKIQEGDNLSVIYSSRMYNPDAELEVPLNFPPPGRKPRNKRYHKKQSNKKFKFHPSRTQSSTAVMLSHRKATPPEDINVRHQCASEVEFTGGSETSPCSEELQAAYQARWSVPFHAFRPPEPTSLGKGKLSYI